MTPLETLTQAWEENLATYLVAPSDEQFLELLRYSSCGADSVRIVLDSIVELRKQHERKAFPFWESAWNRLRRNIRKNRDTWTLEKCGRAA
jgi:hypothetical protein